MGGAWGLADLRGAHRMALTAWLLRRGYSAASTAQAAAAAEKERPRVVLVA